MKKVILLVLVVLTSAVTGCGKDKTVESPSTNEIQVKGIEVIPIETREIETREIETVEVETILWETVEIETFD